VGWLLGLNDGNEEGFEGALVGWADETIEGKLDGSPVGD
jgi:hypothetical protein